MHGFYSGKHADYCIEVDQLLIFQDGLILLSTTASLSSFRGLVFAEGFCFAGLRFNIGHQLMIGKCLNKIERKESSQIKACGNLAKQKRSVFSPFSLKASEDLGFHDNG